MTKTTMQLYLPLWTVDFSPAGRGCLPADSGIEAQPGRRIHSCCRLSGAAGAVQFMVFQKGEVA
jgi:hypothetical protein